MTLEQFLAGVAPVGAPLGLTHCTTVTDGLRAIESGRLMPTFCGEYGVDVLYLFYGRPAFKPLSGLPASDFDEVRPMCLVLDASILDRALRILPFDSGGYDRYAPFVGPGLRREDFEVSGGEMPARIVRAFFESNRNYYDGIATASERDFRVSNPAARGYARLLADRSIQDDDDRRATIEIQLDTPVVIHGALKAIVAPRSVMDEPAILEAQARNPELSLLDYNSYGRARPLAFANSVMERVDKHHTSVRAFA
jgi:hypothetical protein